MPYDVKNLSDYSLEQLGLVMEGLCSKAELNPSSQYFELGPITGVTDSENKAVLDGLQMEGCLGSSYGFAYLKPPFKVLINQVNNELHNRKYHKPQTDKIPKPEKKNVAAQDKLRFDEDGSELIINTIHIKIGLQKNYQRKTGHKLLVYILVKHKDDFFREFSYKEIAISPLFNRAVFPESKTSWRKYHDALGEINKKIIANPELSEFPDFFQYGSSNDSKIFIDPNHLETLGLARPKLE